MPDDASDFSVPGLGQSAEKADTVVREEQGRWVVYLRVEVWSGADGPLERVEKRINDFSTRRAAEVAAHWISLTANKTPFGDDAI